MPLTFSYQFSQVSFHAKVDFMSQVMCLILTFSLLHEVKFCSVLLKYQNYLGPGACGSMQIQD